MKPLLSIIIPVAPGRIARLTADLSRLSLNQVVFPDHAFEVVVLDGGATDNTRELCEKMSEYINLKYIYVPIKKFICAAYPRNVALRACEAPIISMIDIDHWPSENIVYGMLTPFIDDSEFRVVLSGQEVKKIKDMKEYLNGQITGIVKHPIINRGYVIDSSKTRKYHGEMASLQSPITGNSMLAQKQQYLDSINKQLLNNVNFDKKIHDVYRVTEIPPPGVNGTLWTWAVKREYIAKMNAYDENYCKKWAYSREDDSFREHLLAQGLRFFDGQNKNFCAIHLQHPAPCRGQQANELNKKYYAQTCQPVREIVVNKKWQWGKMLEGSFSIINGRIRGVKEHEQWVANNVKDMPNYVNSEPWKDADDFINKLEAI
jgi:glycosyltransferase involved in cell wall biosynthesis